MDLVQLWRNDKNSFARTKDGRLVALNGEEAEHLVVRADQAIPVPLSTGRDTRVSIPRSAHTVVVTDHPLPSHLKATANSHFNTAEFMDIGSLPDNSVVLRIDISPDFNHLLNTETKALAFGAAMKAVFVRYPQLVIGPLSTPEYPNLYRHLEKRIISASLVPETTWASLRTPLFDVIAEKLSLTPDSLNISTSNNDRPPSQRREKTCLGPMDYMGGLPHRASHMLSSRSRVLRRNGWNHHPPPTHSAPPGTASPHLHSPIRRHRHPSDISVEQ